MDVGCWWQGVLQPLDWDPPVFTIRNTFFKLDIADWVHITVGNVFIYDLGRS